MLTGWCWRNVKLYVRLSCALVCDPATCEHYMGSVSKLQGVHPARLAIPGNGIQALLPYVSAPGPRQAIGWPGRAIPGGSSCCFHTASSASTSRCPGGRGSAACAVFPSPTRPLTAAALGNLSQSGLFLPTGRERFLTPLGWHSAGGPAAPLPPFRRRGGRSAAGRCAGTVRAAPGQRFFSQRGRARGATVNGRAARCAPARLPSARPAANGPPRAGPAGKRALTSRVAPERRGGATSPGVM